MGRQSDTNGEIKRSTILRALSSTDNQHLSSLGADYELNLTINISNNDFFFHFILVNIRHHTAYQHFPIKP